MSNINPWIGLNSYQEGQVLYGRSREIQDLSMLVFYNRQTVVYGKSGIGKSSLLHAGIFPMARLRGCLPVSVRFDHASELSCRQQLIRCVTESVLADGGTMGDTQKEKGEPQSLWEFFHRMLPQKDGQIITPLIVIDQFEEIFTLSKNTQSVRDFFEELADLCNDVMPEYLNSDNISRKTRETGSIFDGLQIKPSDDRYANEMAYHMVFVLREDYLSYLERFAVHIPALKQNRYGLLSITYQQAMEIITKPCEGLVSKEVADAIIRHITTEHEINDESPLDSAILSLYLSRLFEKKKDAPVISMQLVKEQGDALIEDFYEEIVGSINLETIEYLEDILINTDGHRENVTIESLYKVKGVDTDAIKTLESAHLLRVFSYGNVQRVEFAHDVLCPIIVRRRSQRKNIARIRKIQRNGILVMMVSFVILFGLLYVVVERIDSKQSLARQQARLNEMEVSLIEKGSQKMLENGDIYGAIHLLINSIDDDLNMPSINTARLETNLRRSIDSLLYSEDDCVSIIQRKARFNEKCVVSKSRRLCGLLDTHEMDILIIDAQTGSIVQVFSTNNRSDYWYEYFYHPSDTFSPNPYVIPSEQLESSIAQTLSVVDIHPHDTRCLLIANDTTLLDCYISIDNDSQYGNTRLCIHDIHSKIIASAYSESGDSIAVQLSDSSILLYDAQTGARLIDHSSIAQYLLLSAEKRRFDMCRKNEKEDFLYSDTLQISDYTKISHYIEGEYIITLSCDKEIAIKNKLLQDTSYVIYQFDTVQDKNMREHLDSMYLSDELVRLQRTYFYKKDTLKRCIYPLAINKSNNRVAVELFSEDKNDSCEIYGIYPHNGAVFFHTKVPHEVQTLHFTEDDQYLVVDAGKDTEKMIYLPPLKTLLDSCKNMFFKWQMTEEERYQTYIHMND